jgi:hypothetical protein
MILKLEISDETFFEGLQSKTGLDRRSVLNEAFHALRSCGRGS